MSIEDKLKKLHGPKYTELTWNCKTAKCCALCKTQNSEANKAHWAKGLCRSCYRRLSATHRLYNDKWNETQVDGQEISEKPTEGNKKNYKYIDPVDITFDQKDVETLLPRYDYSCAYCQTELQDFDHKKLNAFQVEYREVGDKFQLVPACRACNCSKKNLADPDKLKRWAYDKGLKYPFNLKDPPKT